MTSAPPRSTEHGDLRAHVLSRLSSLPQWSKVSLADADRWVDALLQHEPHRADWHIDRLFGFTGSQVGALSGLSAGELHPFHAPDRLVRAKLLMDPPAPPTPDEVRSLAMEPQLRALYRACVTARGGKILEQAPAAIRQHALDNPSGRVGNPPEIVEENGRLYLVNYQCPRDSVDIDYAIDGVPYYLRAQMHHYKAMAERAGFEISGMRLCSLDYKAWNVDEREILFDSRLAVQVDQACDIYWQQYVLQGKQPPSVLIERTDTLEAVRLNHFPAQVPDHDLTARQETGKNLPVLGGTPIDVDDTALRSHIDHRAREFMAWGLAESESKKMREMLQQSLLDILPASAIPLGVDRIDTGHVRLRVDRELDEQALVSEALRLLKESGYDDQAALDYLEQPNFWHPAEFSAQGLIDIIRQETDLDPETDPRFAAARVKEPSRRLDTLLEIVKEMGGQDLDTTHIVKGGRVRMEMPRTPLVGPMSQVRSEAAAAIRNQLGAPLRAIATEVIDRNKVLQDQAPVKPSRRKRSPQG